MDTDEKINEYNNKIKDSHGFNRDELIIFSLTSDLTHKTILVTLKGDGVTCKNCRDKILSGFHWHQGSLRRSAKNE